MDALSRLVDALRCLPGLGPTSARRMVFYLLKEQRHKGLHLAACLEDAMNNIHNCKRCNNYTSDELCKLCSNPTREKTQLCIVEHPSDIAAIEQSNVYKGYYYVLMDKISPLDGVGPEDIGLPKLQELIATQHIQEVILALSPTIEGQATVHFIYEFLRPCGVHVTQLAHGIPSGGELEFLDNNTISNALRKSGYTTNAMTVSIPLGFMSYKRVKSMSTRQNRQKSTAVAGLMRAFFVDFNDVIVDLTKCVVRKNSELGLCSLFTSTALASSQIT